MAGETTGAESTPAPAENGRTEETPQTQAQLPKIGNFLGRHRLSAAIGRLHQEIQSLKSESEELDMMEPSSAACKERKQSLISVKFQPSSVYVLYHLFTAEFSLLWKANQMLCFPSLKALRILHGRDGSSQFEARGTENGGTVKTRIFLN